HIVPFYTALVAVWFDWIWVEKPRWRWMVAAACVLFAGLQISGVAYRIFQNSYAKNFLPAVRYVQSHWRPTDLVMGSAELGFGVGFERLLEDPRLGALTGKRPDFILVSPRWRLYFDDFKRRGAMGGFVARRLESEYRLVFDGGYQVFAPR